MTDKQALRKAAIAATGGQWVFSRSGANSNVQAPIELQKGGRALVVLCKLNNAGWSGQIQTENNAKFIAVANPETVLALLDELEAAEHTAAVNHEAACSLVEENEEVKRKLVAAEKRIAEHNFENRLLANADRDIKALRQRIAELSASHGKLREVMAGIHNTIRMDGGYTPLAAILNAAKRAYDESSAAAGIGKGE